MKKLFLLFAIPLLFSLQVLNVKAAADYGPGSLLVLEGVKDATVYYIDSGGRKWAFPDAKTYYTWYKNFDGVIKVNVKVLDQYFNAGIMPYRPGAKLITHSDTAKIYAVSPSHVIHWIPSPEIAEKLYGSNWQSMVQDVAPGYFSSTNYTIGEDLSDKYPTGALIQYSGNYYYVDGNSIRQFSNKAAFFANNLSEDYLVKTNDISSYVVGAPITGKEIRIAEYEAWIACGDRC